MALIAPLAGVTSIALAGSLSALAGGRAEAAAGAAPLRATAAPEPAITGTLEPLLALELRRPRWSLDVRYVPRIFLRRPNVVDLDRPLLLHRAELFHRTPLTRRLALEQQLTGTFGELDYTASDVAFAAGQPTQLDVAVIDYYDAALTETLTAALTRRETLRFAATAATSGAVGDVGLPTQRRLRLAPEFSRRLTRRDTLTVPAAVERQLVGERGIWTTRLGIGYDRETSRRTALGVSAGALAVTTTDATTFFPTAAANGRALLHRKGAAALSTNATVALTPVLDAVRATYRPTVVTRAALDLQASRAWSSGLDLSVAVPVGSEPLRPRQDESAAFATLPIRYSPDTSWSFEIGMRHAFRSPHPSDGFAHRQAQTWGYVAVTLVERVGDGAVDARTTP